MIPLASSLTAHQKGRLRRPAIEVTASAQRFDIPVLTLTPDQLSATTERPHAAAFYDGGYYQIRNDAGDLDIRLDFGSWTNLASVASDSPVAITATSSQLIIAVGDGTALKVWTSADGVSWSGPATIVTEGTAIGAIALAANPTGNVCAFYSLAGSATLRRLRRTSGTWAGSGTTWTRSADWDEVTGVAAVRFSGYFQVIVTGEAATTLRPTVAAYVMGDGTIPSNSWFGPELIQQADAASTITYANPFIGDVHGHPFATFTGSQTADVAFTARVYLTHGTGGNGLDTWREPTPLPMSGAFGASIAVDDALGTYLATLSEMRSSPWLDDANLSGAVTAISWKQTPTSVRARLTLRYADAAVAEVLRPGHQVTIRHGYRSGALGLPEFGLSVTLAIDRVTLTIAEGQCTATVDAIGAWEALDQWRSPQSWTAPAGTTRGTIFGYIAGRAGLTLASGSGPELPSDAWTNHQPLFAIAAGESGGSVLRRLIEPTSDFLRATNAFLAIGFADADTAVYDYGDTADLHAIAAVSLISDADINWYRVQGPDRYADAFAPEEANSVGPRLQLLRQLSATSDALTEAAAAAALRRARLQTPRASITVPANVGQELYDIVSVTSPVLGLSAKEYRITELAFDYRTTSPGSPVMNNTLTLGPHPA